MTTRRRPTARTATRAATLPPALELARLMPTRRSLLVGVALFVVAVGAYAAARSTSLFAVQTVTVRGGTPAVRAAVRTALAGEVGTSLLRVDGGAIGRRLAGVPAVSSFTYDRAFPHALRVTIRPEHPVLVVRQGAAAFVAASSGRVLSRIAHPRASSLPRLYVPGSVGLSIGDRLPGALREAALALAPLEDAPLPGGVRQVSAGMGHPLALVLGRGLELRLGDTGDLRLKYAIARRILRLADPGAATAGYLDVSLPERPVLALKSQVEG